MTSTGYTNGGAGQSVAVDGSFAWSNPGNALSVNSSFATSLLATDTPAGVHSQYLVVSAYGFAIPAGSTINGITVQAGPRSANFSAQAQDYGVYVCKSIPGTLTGTNKAPPLFPTAGYAFWNAVTTQTYGSSADLWGQTWTAAEINASGFCVCISGQVVGGSGMTLSMDAIRVSIDYTAPQYSGKFFAFFRELWEKARRKLRDLQEPQLILTREVTQ